ncbi:MAG: TolB family protein [Thermodesulfobacteriota bacterium]
MPIRLPCAWALIILILAAGLAWPPAAAGLGQPLPPLAEEREALDLLRAAGPPGEIVFSSRRDGKWRLFRVYSDGSHLARLSQGVANHTRPFFVLGGAKLIYQSDEAGPVQIWMAEPDLSKPQRLSPQGQREYFQGLTAEGGTMLVARERRKDGYLLRRLADGGETPVVFDDGRLRDGLLEAMLSPDGRRLAYEYRPASADEPERGLYTADLLPDGRAVNPRFITQGGFVAWRGDSLAFLASRFPTAEGGPGADIWLCDTRRPLEPLTRNLDWNYYPAFSPDEQWLVWAASPLYSQDQASGRYEIYIKRLHERSPVRLTFHSAPDIEPTWRAQRSGVKGLAPDFIYEAEDYSHLPATALEDAKASGGKAALATREAAQPAPIIYGQYDVLPAGRYVATFRLRLARVQAPGHVAELDVSVQSGQRILARRAVHAQEFASGRYQDFDLIFSSDQLLTALECRVSFTPGRADLIVDLIRVRPYQEPAWHQRAWDWLAGLFGAD